jgi:hypothetical protein
MKISSKDFRVPEGDNVDLKKWPTMVDRVYKSKEQYQELLTDGVLRQLFRFLPPSIGCLRRFQPRRFSVQAPLPSFHAGPRFHNFGASRVCHPRRRSAHQRFIFDTIQTLQACQQHRKQLARLQRHAHALHVGIHFPCARLVLIVSRSRPRLRNPRQHASLI